MAGGNRYVILEAIYSSDIDQKKHSQGSGGQTPNGDKFDFLEGLQLFPIETYRTLTLSAVCPSLWKNSGYAADDQSMNIQISLEE